MRPGYNLGVCKMTRTLLKLNLTFPTIAKLLPGCGVGGCGCGVGGCGVGGCGLLGWQTEGFRPVHEKWV